MTSTWTLSFGGAHVDLVVPAEQVAAFDQLDTHLAGQQRMLEVRRVVDARGQHHDRRVGLVGGRGIAQRPQQVRCVVVDGAHPVAGEQVREDPRHRAPVLHHVGHPRRRSQVVLEDPPGPLLVADHVDARDVDAHAVGRHDADGLAVEVLAGGDQPARDDAVTQDLLVAVDVVEICLEGLDALGDATLQPRPLGGRDDSRDLVQRKRPLLTGQRERDALVDECPAQRLGAVVEVGGIRRRQLAIDALVRVRERCPARRTSRRRLPHSNHPRRYSRQRSARSATAACCAVAAWFLAGKVRRATVPCCIRSACCAGPRLRFGGMHRGTDTLGSRRLSVRSLYGKP